MWIDITTQLFPKQKVFVYANLYVHVLCVMMIIKYFGVWSMCGAQEGNDQDVGDIPENDFRSYSL